MYNVHLTRKSEKILNALKSKNEDTFWSLVKSLKEIGQLGLTVSWVKGIWNNIYRKRDGRLRILFTIDWSIITIWIISLEKDTKKDYKIWVEYIKKNKVTE